MPDIGLLDDAANRRPLVVQQFRPSGVKPSI